MLRLRSQEFLLSVKIKPLLAVMVFVFINLFAVTAFASDQDTYDRGGSVSFVYSKLNSPYSISGSSAGNYAGYGHFVAFDGELSSVKVALTGTFQGRDLSVTASFDDGTVITKDAGNAFEANFYRGKDFQKSTGVKLSVQNRGSDFVAYVSGVVYSKAEFPTDPTSPTDPPKTIFKPTYNNNDRKIKWTDYPSDLYEIVVTDQFGNKSTVVPSTKVYKVPDGQAGTVKMVAKKMDGTVIDTISFDVPASQTDGPGTDPGTNPGTDPGTGPGTDPGTDPSDSGGSAGSDKCFCEQVCKVLPDILGSMGSNLDLIRQELGGLNGHMIGVHDMLNRIWDNGNRLHDDNIRIEGVLNRIDYNTAPLHGDLQEIIRQLSPTRNYYVPSPINPPDYYKPDEVGYKYVDNNTYFRDQGDATVPDAMPVAPDPKAWTFDGVELKQEQGYKPDDNLKQDDYLSKDASLQADDKLQKDSSLSKDTNLQADEKLQRQVEEYELRLKSPSYKDRR